MFWCIKLVLLKAWSPHQQRQHHLGTFWKFIFLSPQTYWLRHSRPSNLCCHKASKVILLQAQVWEPLLLVIRWVQIRSQQSHFSYHLDFRGLIKSWKRWTESLQWYLWRYNWVLGSRIDYPQILICCVAFCAVKVTSLPLTSCQIASVTSDSLWPHRL